MIVERESAMEPNCRARGASRSKLEQRSRLDEGEGAERPRGLAAWHAPKLHETECGLEINCYATAGARRARP